ncbi:hypothetical protein HMPREF9248_0803 [Fannyhessea vaginae PB189-T1-4]|uniref:Photosystem I reaction center subunit VIII n=1 Tax=Fannyhessea vaginae PB189-T1-4 TaxID=866774 RepID=A0ABN0B1Y3_9ACTN|nr:hypothetical protein HMPREF9248_0803 [Fannyhessea vaginae PB189-T1-4]
MLEHAPQAFEPLVLTLYAMPSVVLFIVFSCYIDCSCEEHTE